jgi:hypothetical protein
MLASQPKPTIYTTPSYCEHNGWMVGLVCERQFAFTNDSECLRQPKGVISHG